MAFGRDMFLDIPLIADILDIRNNRQLLVDKRLIRENAKRIKHDYAIDDKVLEEATNTISRQVETRNARTLQDYQSTY